MSGARTLEDDNCCCRMVTTVTTENVSRAEFPVKKDQKLTFAQIQNIMKISSVASLAFFTTAWSKEVLCPMGTPRPE